MNQVNQANRIDLIGKIKDFINSIKRGVASLVALVEDITKPDIVDEDKKLLDDMGLSHESELVKKMKAEMESCYIPLEGKNGNKKGIVEPVEVSTKDVQEAQIKAEQKQRAKQMEQEQKTIE